MGVQTFEEFLEIFKKLNPEQLVRLCQTNPQKIQDFLTEYLANLAELGRERLEQIQKT